MTNWFITKLLHIHDTLWIAEAFATDHNPLTGYSCHGEGRTIDAALAILESNIAIGYNLVPPPSTIHTTPAALDLLSMLGLTTPPPAETLKVRRI